MSSSYSTAANRRTGRLGCKSDYSLSSSEQEYLIEQAGNKNDREVPMASSTSRQSRGRRKSLDSSSAEHTVRRDPIVNLGQKLRKLNVDHPPRKPSQQKDITRKEPVRGTARTVSVSSIVMGDASSVVSGLDGSTLGETSMDSSIDSRATGSRN